MAAAQVPATVPVAHHAEARAGAVVVVVVAIEFVFTNAYRLLTVNGSL